MPNLSTSPFQPSAGAGQNETFVPFVAHIRVVPNLGTGKRWSLFRNLEKTALRVEEDLIDANFNIASPVAFTPQFGDFGARLTVVGFVGKTRLISSSSDDERLVEPPTTNIDLIHSGTDVGEQTALIDGNRGGSLSEAQDPTTTVEEEVAELRILLAAASDQFGINDVVHIEYNGIKYCLKKIGGRSFTD